MTEALNVFFAKLSAEYAGAIFAASLAVSLVACVSETVLAIVLYDYGIKKRARYFLFSGAAVTVAFAVSQNGANKVFSLISLAWAILLAAPVLSVPVRKNETTDKQRELVRYIDGKIKSAESFAKNDRRAEELRRTESVRRPRYGQSFDKDDTPCEIEVLKTSGRTGKDRAVAGDLDLSHIRSVIARLDYYALSAADKRTVGDLNYALNEAERGVPAEEVKEKINDGLGALLKIMSKYGA